MARKKTTTEQTAEQKPKKNGKKYVRRRKPDEPVDDCWENNAIPPQQPHSQALQPPDYMAQADYHTPRCLIEGLFNTNHSALNLPQNQAAAK